MSRSKLKKSLVVLGVVAAVGGAGLAVTGGNSGAYYTDSQTGTVQGTSGNVSINVSDANNASTFKAVFNNLGPGQTQAQKFKVTNSGTYPITVALSGVSNATFTDPAPAITNVNLLTAAIPNYLATTGVGQLPASIDLGKLAVGQSRTYELNMSLADSAGNDWANTSWGATVTVTGTQAH